MKRKTVVTSVVCSRCVFVGGLSIGTGSPETTIEARIRHQFGLGSVHAENKIWSYSDASKVEARRYSQLIRYRIWLIKCWKGKGFFHLTLSGCYVRQFKSEWCKTKATRNEKYLYLENAKVDAEIELLLLDLIWTGFAPSGSPAHPFVFILQTQVHNTYT